MTVAEQIIKLEEEKNGYKGDNCEVYSRIVGYYRPTFAWNDGKAAEYKKREIYDV